MRKNKKEAMATGGEELTSREYSTREGGGWAFTLARRLHCGKEGKEGGGAKKKEKSVTRNKKRKVM